MVGARTDNRIGDADDEASRLLTEVVLTESDRSLGRFYMAGMPQPGSIVEVEGQPYRVLERHHGYQLRQGQYRLERMVVYVQMAQRPEEQSCCEGQWVLGDSSCRFNARSSLIRCAIQPMGPCAGCLFYEPASKISGE